MSKSKNTGSDDASSTDTTPTCYDGEDTISPEHPVLTETDLKDSNYQCVSGKFFTEDGRYVPLSNRPAETTQESILKNHPTVIDVTICGFSTFVTVTDLSEKEAIKEKLRDAVDETLRKTINKRGTYCTHSATGYVLSFRSKGY